MPELKGKSRMKIDENWVLQHLSQIKKIENVTEMEMVDVTGKYFQMGFWGISARDPSMRYSFHDAAGCHHSSHKHIHTRFGVRSANPIIVGSYMRGMPSSYTFKSNATCHGRSHVHSYVWTHCGLGIQCRQQCAQIWNRNTANHWQWVEFNPRYINTVVMP